MAHSCERKVVDNKNGLQMSYLETGAANRSLRQNAAIVFLHGFPELATCWNHQLKHFGRSYWCVAPDQRGYGQTVGWDASQKETFNALNLSKDIIGFAEAIKAKKMLLVGHDFGTTPAFYCTLIRPDLVVGLCNMSIPLGCTPPKMVKNAGGAVLREYSKIEKPNLLHYQRYYGSEAAVDGLNKDPEQWFRLTYSATAAGSHVFKEFSPTKGKVFPLALNPKAPLTDYIPSYASAPSFVDLSNQIAQFQITGFQGALNWYSNVPQNVDMLQLYSGYKLPQPFLFISGEEDIMISMYRMLYNMIDSLPNFRGKHLIPNAGHWVQQEQPEAVNNLLSTFFADILLQSDAKL